MRQQWFTHDATFPAKWHCTDVTWFELGCLWYVEAHSSVAKRSADESAAGQTLLPMWDTRPVSPQAIQRRGPPPASSSETRVYKGGPIPQIDLLLSGLSHATAIHHRNFVTGFGR